ncbi:hypothetical protein PSQ90_01135 [Devosia rhodophyticola]|uniref:Uncharacterized protein n=1 Tax=Devosia rhodophyticola TaxID=3026423 RepID=A0ABY7YXI7_9HYPH|nr:hypothetical protein [Devosia rhodophyticola]WDR06093.1 hypothetical protein PSQ90_01135 [Devosia rhodophyticola]
MDFTAPYIGPYVRVVALLSLLLGLNDASRLLGVQLGPISPVAEFGVQGFILLGIFALCRLFAAVGLWINASWGAVMLVGATVAELILYVTGNEAVQMSALGFAVRLVLLVSIIVIFGLGVRHRRARAHD